MNMKANKVLATLLASIMVLSAMFCGAAKKMTAAASPKLSGSLTIWSWGAGDEKTSRENMVDIFQKEHPEIKITHVVLPTTNSVWDQKSAAAYAAGNAGDVMQMSPDYYGLMSKHFVDLRSYVKKDGVNLSKAVTSGMMNGYYRPNGKLEALPLVANCFVFAYNKTLFDKAKVAYPTSNWTWDDLAKMAPKLVSGTGVNHTYFIVDHWVMPNFALTCEGGEPYNATFTKTLVNSAAVAKGLDLFGKLVKEGAMPNDTAAKELPSEQLFVSGKAAVYPMGGFEIAQISKEIGNSFKWGAVLPPKMAETGKNSNFTYSTGYGLNVASTNKEAAWQFIKEACYGNNAMGKATTLAGMPANSAVASSTYSKISYDNGNVPSSLYVKGMATSRLNPWGGALAAAGDQWTNMWQYVTVDNKTGKQAQTKYYSVLAKAFSSLNIKQ
jgi:ABC-type sugar transport system, periplasmic component